ncbi:MAG: cation-transporting P-type ATPase [Hyphomicrobium sp.]|jgi:magnesium-transporting ATPase (P-type)
MSEQRLAAAELPVQERPSWHAMEARDVAARLKAPSSGLSELEAGARLERFGRNAIPTAAAKSLLRRFLQQFDNLLIYVLLAAASVTALLGNAVDTSVILGVVLINAGFGFIQEGRAEASLAAIRSMISPRASVLRAGRRVTIDAADVVPGDVLLIEAGDRVAADVRLIKARNLRLDEAILTGESVQVEKQVEAVPEEAALGDRVSMAFSGTLVASGQGAGLVVATGQSSELGRISALLGRVEQLETPLIRQMNAFARQLTLVILGLSALTFAFAVLVRGYAMAEAFMAIVGMAIAAIPEGLPAVMTITLAIGVQRMAARNAIVRRLPAVETLGSVSVICSDKTGTLTRNEMTVTRIVLADRSCDIGGIGYAPSGGICSDGAEVDPASVPHLNELITSALLCNDASLREVDGHWIVDGDPMEGALVALGRKVGLDRDQLLKRWPRLDEIPFDSAHRFMSTLHQGHDGAVIAYVKGAPERIIEMCHGEATESGVTRLDHRFWHDAVEKLARDGQRVLALARSPQPSDKRTLGFDDIEQGLTLLGLVGLIDPPRAEAIAAVGECRDASIAVKMITGDHVATAGAIARKLGLSNADHPLTGRDIDGLDPAQLCDTAAAASVFARTSPEHKLRLVEALQSGGAVIAMTGDGVNDAPALKRADVGVAMGRNGTEAAKEAADIVLADDNFASIVAAVREGRTVYDNLTKVIGWTLPTSGGVMVIIAVAILFDQVLPITPRQILWINMVTAVGLGLVLAFEPPEPNIMRRPPRAPDEPLLSPFLLWRLGLVSILIAAGAFGMFTWVETRGLSHEEARTVVVNAVVVMEIFYLFSVRYLHGASASWQGVLGTPAVLIGVGGVVALQIAFTYLPVMQMLFDTRPVMASDAIVIVAVGVALFSILEVEKLIRRKLFAHD